MDSRERLHAAMTGGVPDRVPVMCQLALGHYFLHAGLDPVEIWHSTEGFAQALVRLQRRYGFDGILVNLPGRPPRWRDLVRRIDDAGAARVVTWTNGWRTIVPPDDNPRVLREDGSPPSVDPSCLEPAALAYFDPHELPVPSPAVPAPWRFDTVRRVRELAGPAVAVHGEVFSPLSQWVEMLGIEPALVALMDDPGRGAACLDALADGAAGVARGLVGAGADAVLISSAYAGSGFLSRRHYERFVLPFERRLAAAIHATGVPAYTHTCGAIGDRLDLMEATGVDGIDTLDPPPLGDVDLAEARARTRGRLFLKGNVDPVNVVLRGTPASVVAAARRCLEAVGDPVGYVLSTACSVPPAAPPDNVRALAQAVAPR